MLTSMVVEIRRKSHQEPIVRTGLVMCQSKKQAAFGWVRIYKLLDDDDDDSSEPGSSVKSKKTNIKVKSLRKKE
ncbi:hypothetical protein Hdeb2414_s0007g00258761 [Helianthus debilis subsp. tardiflorus]